MSNIQANKATPLWTWKALSAGLTDGAIDGPDVTSVSADSRLVAPGALFIALPGDPGSRFNPSYVSDIDGHDFLLHAMESGAVGALVHKPRDQLAAELPADFPLLRVADTYDGLWALGELARKRLTGAVVAVTGSSGKTTAKHFFTQALGAYSPPGSFNNHIGVPLALANAPQHTPYSVFEVGTNHPGEIEPLAQMVHPDVAVLLNVQQAHIENFANWDALREEKFSIFNALDDKSNAISEDLLELPFGYTFGLSAKAHARVLHTSGDRTEIDLFGVTHQANVPGGGVHRALTVAATLLVCKLLDVDVEAACELSAEVVPKGRGNIVEVGLVRIIDDSYNANPDSMRAGIATLQATPANQRIAVIGEMLELGGHSHAAHLSLAEQLSGLDAVFCVGEGTKPLAAQLGCSWAAQADADLARAVAACAKPHTVLLVKGSNRVFWANNFVGQLAKNIET